jgi:P27 family predicted phage terminase small subunit
MKNSGPEAPGHLSSSAAAWWRRIADEFVLDDAALLILTAAGEAFDRMRQAQALVEKHGIVSPDRFGQLKTNPAVLVERDSRSAMLAAIKALHLDIEPLNDRPGRPPGS